MLKAKIKKTLININFLWGKKDNNQAKSSMEYTVKQQEASILEDIKQEPCTSDTATTTTTPTPQTNQTTDSKSVLQKLNELASFNKVHFFVF